MVSKRTRAHAAKLHDEQTRKKYYTTDKELSGLTKAELCHLVRIQQMRLVEARKYILDMSISHDAMERKCELLSRRLYAIDGERGKRTYQSIRRIAENRERKARRVGK